MPESTSDLDNNQFQQWQVLIKERSGMSVAQERKTFLVNRLRGRMEVLRIETFDDYYRYIQSGSRGRVEWTCLVDLLTVHETFFFRDPGSLKYLSQAILPSHHQGKSEVAEYRVWSVGCSTGEEAYSLAMVIDESYRTSQIAGYYSITATDISLSSLNTARRGLYSDYAVEKVSPDFRRGYFVGPSSGYYRVKEDLRKRICFTSLNILELNDWSMTPQNLIYCQNMLIYFEREQRHIILDQLMKYLLPGGVLMIGAGEGAGWENDQMQQLQHSGVTAFQRRIEVSEGSAG